MHASLGRREMSHFYFAPRSSRRFVASASLRARRYPARGRSTPRYPRDWHARRGLSAWLLHADVLGMPDWSSHFSFATECRLGPATRASIGFGRGLVRHIELGPRDLLLALLPRADVISVAARGAQSASRLVGGLDAFLDDASRIRMPRFAVRRAPGRLSAAGGQGRLKVGRIPFRWGIPRKACPRARAQSVLTT